jgi:hypothetical protein
MIAINHTLISEDIFDKKFVCDLNACKGECCVSGDSGAPLNKKELKILDKVYPSVKPYMNEKGIAAVEKQGTYILDSDGDYTTTLVSDGEECAFVFLMKKILLSVPLNKPIWMERLIGKNQSLVIYIPSELKSIKNMMP